MKNVPRETQTLRAGCSKAEPKKSLRRRSFEEKATIYKEK